MRKLNKKQKQYLDTLVNKANSKLELSNFLYNSHAIENKLISLGCDYENLIHDMDRYCNDRYNETRGLW